MVEFEVLTVNVQGQPLERSRRATQLRSEPLASETLEPVVLDLVAIPSGDFLMGAPTIEEGWHPSQSQQHLVSVAACWMGRYPVTQAQWRAVAALPAVNRPLTPNPACFVGAAHPVEQITWHDAIEFCARLSMHTGREYRLPSEAEWEYACRATTQTPFHFGETITTDLANYSGVNWEYNGRLCNQGFYGKGPTGCDRRETTEVGSFGVANPFGLWDMHGLVREWCADCWHDTYDGAPTDGAAWIENGNCRQRVLRGGSWNAGPRTCRSAFRSRFDAEGGLYDVGFRVVCSW